MSEAIDEMRAYFNQPPVPPAGCLLEHRKKVNGWLDAADAENQELQKLVEDLWLFFHSKVNKYDTLEKRFAIYDDLADRVHALGIGVPE